MWDVLHLEQDEPLHPQPPVLVARAGPAPEALPLAGRGRGGGADTLGAEQAAGPPPVHQDPAPAPGQVPRVMRQYSAYSAGLVLIRGQGEAG